jgi:hypothetical protein
MKLVVHAASAQPEVLPLAGVEKIRVETNSSSTAVMNQALPQPQAFVASNPSPHVAERTQLA